MLFPLSQIWIKGNLHLQLCPDQSHQERVFLLGSDIIYLMKLTWWNWWGINAPEQSEKNASRFSTLQVWFRVPWRKTILCLLITHDETFMAMHRLRDYIAFPRGFHSSPLGKNGVNITDDNFKRHVLWQLLILSISSMNPVHFDVTD